MFRSTAFRLAGILLLAGHSLASAQTPATKPQAPAGQKPQPAPAQPGAPGEPGSPFDILPGQPRRPGQLLNIRLDLTITDQRSNNTPATKTVTMLVSDKNSGRIRTNGDVKAGMSFRRVTLNVDATPEILADGRIRVSCVVEYSAQLGQGNQDENQPTTVYEMFNVILQDGKQMLVTQSADPASDRKVQVELKATVVK